MNAGEVICRALIAGKSHEEIHELLKASHPTGKAARSPKSCREQVAWYRSQLKRGRLFVSPAGDLMDLRKKDFRGHTSSLKDNLGVPNENAKDCDNTPSYTSGPDATSLKSTFYQQLVEHVFIAEVLQEAWFGYQRIVEILRAEVDTSGFDLVFECDGILRFVQLKTSKHDGRRRSVNVNIALADKPGGCVVWLLREEDHATRRINLTYLFFGGAPGEKLPGIKGFKFGKHSKGDSTGKKNERPSIRLVPKTKFSRMDSIRDLVEQLFGVRRPLDGDRTANAATVGQ